MHDVGGPVGFEWAVRNPGRVISLTALNTLVDAASFHRPWPMHPFSIRGAGELWLAAMTRHAFRAIYRLEGLGDRGAVSAAELDAHHHLLKRDDGGRAFLRIMRGFELTEARERFLVEGLAGRDYPTQVVWGERDRMLGAERRGAVAGALGVERPVLLGARHFLQEDRAAEIAASVAALAALGRG